MGQVQNVNDCVSIDKCTGNLIPVQYKLAVVPMFFCPMGTFKNMSPEEEKAGKN